jgi:molecular chaperone GrpE (heat shock protein)
MGRSGKRPKDELKPGYLAEFLIKKVDAQNKSVEVELQQVPEIQAAMVCLNAHTGEIIAEVRRGYRLGQRLLRPAQVKVARA